MALYRTDEARPLVGGFKTPLSCVTDKELAARLLGYRRRVASGYIALTPEDDRLDKLRGEMHVSPKIDGHLWYLVYEDGRPRVGGVGRALAGGADADVRRLGFAAFDLLQGGTGELVAPLEDYGDRLEALRALFPEGKRVQSVKTETARSPSEIRQRFASWVDGGKAEGLVVRPPDGRIYKVKPVIPIDAVVIGFTRRGEDPTLLRSALLALRRDHDQLQVLGSVGNFGEESVRRELLARLEPLVCESTFRKASSDGSLYQFVKPELVVEFKVSDIQAEDSGGDIVRRMVLEHDDAGGWRAVRPAAGVSIIHPVFLQVREDKTPSREEIRIEQVLDRCEVPDVTTEVHAIELPAATLVRREVWTKTTRDKLAVRKLLVWRTNKEETSAEYPAFVVKWVDYSPGRKEPIQHTVKLAPDEAVAEELAEALIAKGVKKGWAPVGDTAG